MQAFAYCDNLAQVTFAEDSCLEIIDPLAFSGCDNLTYIKMPDRIRVIERLAFRNCTCEFPNRCLVMTPNFEGCKVITYEPNLPPLAPIEQDELGNKYRLNEARDGYIVETLYAKEDVIEVPEMFNGLPVVELGNMAFTWNTEAWKTIIPASVKKAGYFPFYACDEMGYAEYGGTIKEWTEMDIYTWFNVHCKDGIIDLLEALRDLAVAQYAEDNVEQKEYHRSREEEVKYLYALLDILFEFVFLLIHIALL